MDKTSGFCNWVELLGLQGDVSNGGINESIDIDDNGTLYVSGSYKGQISFGGLTPINSTGNQEDIFLGRLNPSGAAISMLNLGGPLSNDLVGDMVVDQNGIIYLTGSFTQQTDLGGGTVTTVAAEEAFIARYEPNGIYTWHNNTNGLPGHRAKGTGIGIDRFGDAYIAGFFDGNMLDFNGAAILSNPTANTFGFVAGYELGGAFKFANLPLALSGNASCSPEDLITTRNGISFYAGAFTGDLDFHPNQPWGELNAIFTDGFLAKVDHSGALVSRPTNNQPSVDIQTDAVSEIVDVNIYPNPSRGQLRIEVKQDGSHHLMYQLYDSSGRIQQSADNEFDGTYVKDLQLETLPKGMYFLRLDIDGKSTVKKIVIE